MMTGQQPKFILVVMGLLIGTLDLKAETRVKESERSQKCFSTLKMFSLIWE